MSKDDYQSAGELFAGLDSVVSAIYQKSRGDEFGLTRQQFDSVLLEICRKYLPADAAQNDVRELCASLRVEELALARACSAGDNSPFASNNRKGWSDSGEKWRRASGSAAQEASCSRVAARGLWSTVLLNPAR